MPLLHRFSWVGCFILIISFATGSYSQTKSAVLDDSLVITLLKLHTPPATIILIIQDKRNSTTFTFTPADIGALYAAAVPKDVLVAMFDATAQQSAVKPIEQPAPQEKAPDVTSEETTPTSSSSLDFPAIGGSAFPIAPANVANKVQSEKSPKTEKEKVAQTKQPSNPPIYCADFKTMPSVYGNNPTDGQATLAGCVDATVTIDKITYPISAVWIETTKSDQAVPCDDPTPTDFNRRIRLTTLQPPNNDDKHQAFSDLNLYPPLETNEEICLIEEYDDDRGTPMGIASAVPVLVKPTFKNMAPLGEALVGVDVEGASSAPPQAVLLALGNFDLPLQQLQTLSNRVPFDRKLLWVSGALGLKGMAQPTSLSSSLSSGFYASAAGANPDQIVQSMDASIHFGWQFQHWKIPIGTFDVAGSNGSTQERESSTLATLSLIAGGGAITPLSVSQITPQVYEATPLILQTQTPVAPYTSFEPSCKENLTSAPTCYVVFIPTDRTHFYRSYDAGLRLKLYANDYKDYELRFPAIIDLTLGQNEYVTGGTLHGAVLHLGGSFPFPRLDSVYAFGALDMGMSLNNGGGPQLQLIPAPATAGVSATSPSVYTILTTQPNRDRYELGFGVDVYHLFSKYFEPNSAQGSQVKSQ